MVSTRLRVWGRSEPSLGPVAAKALVSLPAEGCVGDVQVDGLQPQLALLSAGGSGSLSPRSSRRCWSLSEAALAGCRGSGLLAPPSPGACRRLVQLSWPVPTSEMA